MQRRFLLKLVFLLLFSFSFSQTKKDSKVLKVGVYISPPFGMQHENGKFDGLMVKLWESIAEKNQWKYEYETGNLNQILEGLQSNRIDVGLGAISITPAREGIIDFSQAVNPSGTGIAILNENRVGFFGKWGPILLDLFELIVIMASMLFISAFLVWIAERKYNKGDPSDRQIENLADGLWWSAVTMTTVGYGDKVPSSKFGKVLGIVWIFVSIIFFSLFTAKTSSRLNESNKSSMNRIEDLYECDQIIAVENSSGAEYLKQEQVNFIAVSNITQAIEKLIQGEADALVSNIPVLKYQNRKEFKSQLLISDEYLLRNNMGIALPEDSPLREAIDNCLLRTIIKPEWKSTTYRYFGDNR